MPEGQVLEFDRVTKRFGAVTAVADLSVRVEPGVVTGFLGPNGAGKTTTLRILLGQIRPTSGSATVGGVSYSELRNPLRTVGAVLEEAAYRPRRTAARQLLIAAKANGIPAARVDEVLRLVGLQEDADTRLGSYSLGMRQRLAVASALLGDPGVLVLDEPANGLDPEGIRWMRLLMRRLADEGRTVLVSSHVLSEIEQVADNVVVLSKGRSVYSGGIDELADPSGGAVIVDAENRAPLITALSSAKLTFDVLRSGVTVRGSDAATVGAVTAAAGIPLTVLQQRGPSLEDVFLDLVYGRRADSPRLDKVANPVAHAPLSAEDAAEDSALLAGGVAASGAAAAVADGGMVAAAGVGYGTTPADAAPDAEGDDATVATVAAAPAAEPSGDTDLPAGAEAPSDDERHDADEASPAGEAEGAGTAADDVALEHPDEPSDADAERPTEAETDQTDESDEHADAGSEPTTATAAIRSLWAPRAEEPAATEESPASESTEGETHETRPSAAASSEGESPADAEHDAGNDAEQVPAEGVLPLATQAVSIPSMSESSTFTELITGIPSNASEDQAAPATEAISVFNPLVSSDDDDDSTVDDAEDDPRLSAMRTSLSSAASRFFEGPAPDYPYGPVSAAPAAAASTDEPGQSDEQGADRPADDSEANPDTEATQTGDDDSGEQLRD
ncbi:ATP-binding cassette domain-containing protein [Microbacterium sp. NPDC058342]|uniref:ATP-binding cassette domain-containing protein n=1 Tax=Microbacterium sp. NPDC058342 TaxID=3346454 RepID=UPI00366862B5